MATKEGERGIVHSECVSNSATASIFLGRIITEQQRILLRQELFPYDFREKPSVLVKLLQKAISVASKIG